MDNLNQQVNYELEDDPDLVDEENDDDNDDDNTEDDLDDMEDEDEEDTLGSD